MNEASALLTFLKANVGLNYRPVICGGYARDQILGREPRDIDVFLLNAADGVPTVIRQLAEQHIIHTVVPKTYSTAELMPQFEAPINFQFLRWPVQLICTPFNEIGKVLQSFDYNVCRFFIDETRMLALPFSPDDLDALVRRTMRLQHTRTPWSSLRRGILMADRFGFNFHEDDRRRLIEALHAELNA